MRLQDIMTTNVETIGDHESVVLANELMWRKQMHHLVVVKDNNIVGILSDTDLGGPDAEDIPDDLQVHRVMSTKIVTAAPETTLKDAVNLMRGHQIHCLPVIDEDNRLVGIVTTSDIERLEKRGTAQPPYDGIRPQKPYVRLDDRDKRGAKSKYGHSEWPDQAPSRH